MKTSAQIRQDFLDFFASKNHLIVPSAPVVPADDPTLLFTNAGMNQFKPLFLGEKEALEEKGASWKRAADTQKCIRVSGKHNDLEEVGVDTYHHTLFEMLGNWSFGDYFKTEAIEWAWELLVDVWSLDPSRLYATVFGGDELDGLPVDEEAIELWKKNTTIDPSHILRFGKKDNFWEMGDTGPCGPCSEIHIDLRSDEERAAVDGATLVNADDPRVMEIWNLVFIQFNRQNDGSLVPLPAQHVDTGMGFERICAVLQNKTSNYDSDVFAPLLSEIQTLSGKSYGLDSSIDIAMRVIADHIRAVSFSVADGASPGNDGRGYVIRRILRRAIRYGWDRLSLKEPFMYKLVPVLAQQFKEVFPEVNAQLAYVQNVIQSEEKNFLKTLGQGIQLFEQMIEGKQTLSGKDAFKLHDTYGFPIDLTQLMARERGIQVESDQYEIEMNAQKERARAAGKFAIDHNAKKDITVISEGDNSLFLGYDKWFCETEIRYVQKINDQSAVVLSQTPFYAESGGQVGDTGTLSKGSETIHIVDTKKVDGIFLHIVEDIPSSLDGTWVAQIDTKRRNEIQKHHSATHLVHAELREALGTHVAQKGSLVNEHHLRFDFSHFEAVKPEELAKIEERVNEKIQENIPLKEERNVPIDVAQKSGAMMLFGEKYGDTVRIITFDDSYSKELCGGTHVKATGEIGYFRFLSESSVASGVRRIEAVTGMAADLHLRKEKDLLHRIKSIAGPIDDIVTFLEQNLKEKKELEKNIEAIKFEVSSSALNRILGTSVEMSGKQVSFGEIPEATPDVLKQLGYQALDKVTKNRVTVMASRNEEAGKVYLCATVTEDLIAQGIKAGALVGKLARLVGGGGGGQPSLATAGGKNPSALPDAFNALPELLG